MERCEEHLQSWMVGGQVDEARSVRFKKSIK